MRWRFAVYDRSRWVAIQPLHHSVLQSANRVSTLIEQVRIVPRVPRVKSVHVVRPLKRALRHRPESVLEPLHSPLEQRLLVRQNAIHWKQGSWTEITRGRAVEVEQSRQKKVTVTYRVDDARLGSLLRVFVDGAMAEERRAVTRSQSVPLEVSPGRHELKVEGLGPNGVAYVDARPVDRGFIVRRRIVHELPKGTPLVYRFYTQANEGVALIVQIATEKTEQPWTIRYQLFGGRGNDALRPASNAGVWTGVGKRAPRAWFWDMSPLLQEAGMSEVHIRVPRSKEPQLHTLTLLLASQQVERAWVRAVLAGQAPDASPERIFVTREGKN
jgi:hypothetical protein